MKPRRERRERRECRPTVAQPFWLLHTKSGPVPTSHSVPNFPDLWLVGLSKPQLPTALSFPIINYHYHYHYHYHTTVHAMIPIIEVDLSTSTGSEPQIRTQLLLFFCSFWTFITHRPITKGEGSDQKPLCKGEKTSTHIIIYLLFITKEIRRRVEVRNSSLN